MRTLRCTLTQIAKEAQLDESSGQLTIWARPVAVVYLRAGYAPEHYPTDLEWQARCVHAASPVSAGALLTHLVEHDLAYSA